MMRAIGAAVALVASSVVWTASASASASGCGSTITADTLLTVDLSCPVDAITIAAPNVTLDLGGHRVTSTAAQGAAVRLSGRATDVTVRNGRIEWSRFGVDVPEGADRADVSGISFVADGDAVRAASAGDRIHGNQFLTSTGSAVLLRANGAVVEGNAFYRNAIAVFAGSSNATTVSGNAVVGEGGDDSGVLFLNSYGTRFTGNSVSDYTQRSGVSIIGGSAEIAGNQVFANGDGVSVMNARALVTGNVAFANERLGIDAPGALDGGGNRAWGNGDSRQCVGVACG